MRNSSTVTAIAAALLGGSLLAACASQDTAHRMSGEELKTHCQGQMYSERVGRGRSAPNWSVYDECMRRHS